MIGSHKPKPAVELAESPLELGSGDSMHTAEATPLSLEPRILDGLPYFISYRNRADDPILRALENAAKKLKAEGKPLFHPLPDPDRK